MACPAFLSAARWSQGYERPTLIGVNLMPLGSHYDLDGDFPSDQWHGQIRGILKGLRSQGHLIFIAHDEAEVAFQNHFLEAGERVFYSPKWRDYMDVLSGCSLMVANRVHGAVTAAGFGIPAIIIGNDTRAQIGDYLGLPRHRSGFTCPSTVIEQAGELITKRRQEKERLLSLRTSTLHRYVELILPLVEAARARKERH